MTQQHRLIGGACALAFTAGAAYAAASFRAANPAVVVSGQPRQSLVTAPGSVEPVSEEIAVGAAVPGKLEEIAVEEGSHVRAGDVIAVLANADLAAQVEVARATLQEREAALRRVVNGARNQERLEAMAAVEEADAVLATALDERDRRRALLEQGAISREEAARAEQTWLVAAARQRGAVQRFELIDDNVREEDRARAEAAVGIARAAVVQSEALLAKTYIRSPIDGVVLRKHHHRGETVLTSQADPVATIGDISRLRVRAEVDESDVARVRAGQRVYVRADAFGDRRFTGVVSEVGQSLGQKRIQTGHPEDRADAKVLEALIALDNPQGLRPRLRVDVFIDGDEGNHGTR
jgi:ABC exporter DevB family membrane fusion protein